MCTRDGLKLIISSLRFFMLNGAYVHACRLASVQPRARPYLQLEQLDRGIDLLNERRLEVDL